MKILSLGTISEVEIIQQSVAVLKNGGLVIYPTETCYGVGVDATDKQAVAKLLAYKSKRSDKPISVAVPDIKMAHQYADLNQTALKLYKNYLPGPVTIVSKGLNKLAPGIQSSFGNLGVRIPDYDLVRQMVKVFGRPISATSANASYKKTPYKISDILDNLSAKQKTLIDLIIDAGELPKRCPSLILDTTLPEVKILRKGDVDLRGFQVFTAESEKDTSKFAQMILDRISKNLAEDLVVFELSGQLGSGKTRFTKFLFSFLGVKQNVSSPTFILCAEYHGKKDSKPLDLYHIDTYRLLKPEEMEDLRPEEMFKPTHVVVIEWANKVSEYISKYLSKAVVVKIKISSQGGRKRKFEYFIQTPV